MGNPRGTCARGPTQHPTPGSQRPPAPIQTFHPPSPIHPSPFSTGARRRENGERAERGGRAHGTRSRSDRPCTLVCRGPSAGWGMSVQPRTGGRDRNRKLVSAPRTLNRVWHPRVVFAPLESASGRSGPGEHYALAGMGYEGDARGWRLAAAPGLVHTPDH